MSRQKAKGKRPPRSVRIAATQLPSLEQVWDNLEYRLHTPHVPIPGTKCRVSFPGSGPLQARVNFYMRKENWRAIVRRGVSGAELAFLAALAKQAEGSSPDDDSQAEVPGTLEGAGEGS